MTSSEYLKASSNMVTAIRTHTCNDLSEKNISEKVRLAGWVFRKRDHGSLLFIDLRDHYGVTQIVFEDNLDDKISSISMESVIQIHGVVSLREEDTFNDSIFTGKIEIKVQSYEILSEAKLIPFQIDSDNIPNEDLRLRYRFLDLRRQKMQENILLRSQIISFLRKQMEERHFTEINTPILTSSSPEGARDFLIPSRLNPGKFYALPQAPQQFKQLLMVSGFDKYFQIAPCFRDEDSRSDRSPGEFYQLDIEMAFASEEDVFSMIEPILYNTFKKFTKEGRKISPYPFARIPYREAIASYGSDKPDLRNPLKIDDATSVFANSSLSIFVNSIAKGAVVRTIKVANIANKPRSFFDKLNDYVKKDLGGAGLGYIIFDENNAPKGPIAKFVNEEDLAKLQSKPNDVFFFVCDQYDKASELLGIVRTKLGNDLNLIDKTQFTFCWIHDFPFFEEKDGKIEFSHNPFSMPKGGYNELVKREGNKDALLELTAYQYDIVCNGVELSSGAIRNYSKETMYKAFEIAGYDESVVNSKFPSLLNAFDYGAPPHGGIAPGIERIIMLIAEEENIREITPFPMNSKAQDLLMQAPSEINEIQLRELGIQIRKKK